MVRYGTHAPRVSASPEKGLARGGHPRVVSGIICIVDCFPSTDGAVHDRHHDSASSTRSASHIRLVLRGMHGLTND